MQREDFIRIGSITKCNRKTGELTVRLFSEMPETFAIPGFFFLEIDGGPVPFSVKEAWEADRKTLRLLLEDYDTPELAAPFVGSPVLLTKKELEGLEGNPYDYGEIIGFEVIDKHHGSIGVLKDVLTGNQQELLQIDSEGKEVLVPLVDELFEKIDREAKKLFVRAPEGLIDLYL